MSIQAQESIDAEITEELAAAHIESQRPQTLDDKVADEDLKLSSESSEDDSEASEESEEKNSHGVPLSKIRQRVKKQRQKIAASAKKGRMFGRNDNKNREKRRNADIIKSH